MPLLQALCLAGDIFGKLLVGEGARFLDVGPRRAHQFLIEQLDLVAFDPRVTDGDLEIIRIPACLGMAGRVAGHVWGGLPRFPVVDSISCCDLRQRSRYTQKRAIRVLYRNRCARLMSVASESLLTVRSTRIRKSSGGFFRLPLKKMSYSIFRRRIHSSRFVRSSS